MRLLLGTFVEIGLKAPVDGGQNEAGDDAAQLAISWLREIQNIECLLSFHHPSSELSRLNGAGGRWVSLQPTTLYLLRLAQAMMRASCGLFDFTLGGTLVCEGLLPDHGGDYRLAGCAEDIEFGRGRARLLSPVRLCVDGIAKGYAVDLAVRALQRAGFTSGWVNAGGDLRVFGTCALSMQRREIDGGLSSLGLFENTALASSAAGIEDSRFPGAIRSGTSAVPAVGVWSVRARRAWRADALTKVAALAPAAERETLVAALGGRLVGATRVVT